MAIPKPNDLVRLVGEQARIRFHQGQRRAWRSDARFVFVLAGTQGGKTVFGPWWLNREIDRTASPLGNNDYLAVTASYDLFKLKMLPEMRRVFENVLNRGRYWSGTRTIELRDPNGKFWAVKGDDLMWGRIILRSAQSDGGLEAATAKAAWMDECGMDEFKIDHWEAVQRRLSLHLGRALGTTTLYNRGWMKSQVYDPWTKGDSTYAVVQFPSYINPAFPMQEYERIVKLLPMWKVNMFYRGEFDVPAGLIYDNFSDTQQIIKPFAIPKDWETYGFIDFGGVNTTALKVRVSPEKVYYITDEYWEGGRTAAGHANELKEWGGKVWYGGSGSEDQWRLEFRDGGLNVQQPSIGEVEVGIDRVYGAHAEDRIFVFETCTHYIDQKGTYRRELDRDGQPTEKIHRKNDFHFMDAERYGISTLETKPKKAKVVTLGKEESRD